MEKKWIELKTKIGQSVVSCRLESLPSGPYFLVEQHKEIFFLRDFLTMRHEPLKDFTMKLGYATYAIDIASGMPTKIAYIYDTSD